MYTIFYFKIEKDQPHQTTLFLFAHLVLISHTGYGLPITILIRSNIVYDMLMYTCFSDFSLYKMCLLSVVVKYNIRWWSGLESRSRRVSHILREILKEGWMYSYAPDLVIGCSLLCVNITQTNQCNLIGGTKVNVNIEYWNRKTSPLELIWWQGYTIRCL